MSGMTARDPYDSALSQLQRFGLEVDAVDTSGTLRRVRHGEDKSGSKNGWYVAHEITTTSGRRLIVGAYGWWKAGDQAHKLAHDGAGLSIDEQREIEARRRDLEGRVKLAREQLAQEAADRAAKIWPGLAVEGPSAYLERKKVAAFGVRFARGMVVVPVRNADEDLVGLQWIAPDGAKRFLTGTAKQGAFHLTGPLPGPGEVLAIAEGYATAATAAMAMGWTVAVAFDAGNLAPVARALRSRCPGARLIVLADDDHATKGNPGVTKATAAARATRGVVAVPRFASSAEDRGTDWNDLACTEGLDAVRAQLRAAALDAEQAAPKMAPDPMANVVSGAFPGSDWVQRLIRTEKGSIKSSAFNVRLILEHDPAWSGVLGWCMFSARITKKALPPYANASRGEWNDADDADLRFWLAERYGIEPKGQDLADPVSGAARGAPFHPVQDYLGSLRWDGVARLDRWLETYLGAHAPDDETGSGDDQRELVERALARERAVRYLRRVSAMSLIQAVARVRKPGCKADYVLILEGAQGRQKSTALATLFGREFFSDTPIDLGSKDAYEAIRGLWCCEMAELDSLNKADATRAKAFFSSASDRFRMPYGHRAQTFPRQCVVCGTTNQHQYLKDQTGNRRYWPVQCGEIDIESLGEMRDQLWAEADHRYQAGETWWPRPEERDLFEGEQQIRTDADAWEPLIQAYLHGRMQNIPPPLRPTLFLTGADVMRDALHMDAGAMRRPEQTRVGIIMQALGWRAVRVRVDGLLVRGYRPGLSALADFDDATARARAAVSAIHGGDDGPQF